MNLFEIVRKNDMVKILLVLLGVYLFMKYYYNKEKLDNTSIIIATNVPGIPSEVPPPIKIVAQAPPEMTLQAKAPTETEQQQNIDAIVAGRTQLTTAELLPNNDIANAFTKENPVSKLLQEQNFLQAGYHMGINTVVQSNKIKYLDIRSCPPIPKQEVSPFLNSSYEQPAGSGRRYLDIGSA